MNDLNQIEIQNIRHLVGNMSAICDKTAYYKTLTKDTKISNKYDSICECSANFKNELIGLFQEV